MDGYTIRVKEYKSLDTEKETKNVERWTHHVVDKVYAGDTVPAQTSSMSDASASQLPTALYVTTGAAIPDSFDCVVPIEVCEVSNDKSSIAIDSSAIIKPQQWIRPVGCDIPQNSIVLPKGHVLDPVALGLLRQAGRKDVKVVEPLTVGVLSTGNELLSFEDHWSPGDFQNGIIPDVNRPILLSLLSTYGNCSPKDIGVARDDDTMGMMKAIQTHLEHCEVIITTGGISMGETDIVEDVLVNKLGGTLHFGRMNMKPGKPTTFVTIPSKWGTRLVFAMPGNPVSATVCTQLLVKPCIDALFNGRWTYPSGDSMGNREEALNKMVQNSLLHPEINVVLQSDIKLDFERPEYHRVIVEQRNNIYYAISTGVQRSSRLMSMRDADGLLVLPRATNEKPAASAGESYTLLLLNSPGSTNPRRKLKESKHMTQSRKRDRTFKVGVVRIIDETTSQRKAEDAELCERIKLSLSGAKSGSVSIACCRSFPPDATDLHEFILLDSESDIHIVVTCTTFERNVRLAKELRRKLSNVADSMALQARKGIASSNPAAAIFEIIVGFESSHGGSLTILLPEAGAEDGLANVRGLLKHALEIARGDASHTKKDLGATDTASSS